MLRRIRDYLRSGWRTVTEFHTAQWVAGGLLSLLPAGALTALASYWGEHSATLMVIAFIVTLCAVALLFLGLFGSVSASIPVYRPTKLSERTTSAASNSTESALAACIEEINLPEYGDLSAFIARWSNDFFPGSAVARNTEAWNVVHRATEELKRRLRLVLFSRFSGSSVYVSDHILTSGHSEGTLCVHYVGALVRDVELMRIFVDSSYQTEQGGWTGRERLFLAEVERHRRSQPFNFAILSKMRTDEQSEIMWGSPPSSHKIYPRPVYCRARLVFKGDEGGEQYYYFMLITPPHQAEMVIAIDQRNMEFPDQWFAEDIRAR